MSKQTPRRAKRKPASPKRTPHRTKSKPVPPTGELSPEQRERLAVAIAESEAIARQTADDAKAVRALIEGKPGATPAILRRLIERAIDIDTRAAVKGMWEFAGVGGAYADHDARRLGEFRDRVRKAARELRAASPSMPAIPDRVEDPNADLQSLAAWCTASPERVALPTEHRVGPMSKAEAARRITQEVDARWRQVESLFKLEDIESRGGKSVMLRVDRLDANTRTKLDRPFEVKI